MPMKKKTKKTVNVNKQTNKNGNNNIVVNMICLVEEYIDIDFKTELVVVVCRMRVCRSRTRARHIY